MTKEQYVERFAKHGIIGLCELCHNFNHCASLDDLSESGCSNHSNYNEDDV